MSKMAEFQPEIDNKYTAISAYRPVSSWFFPHPYIWLFGTFIVGIEIFWILATNFTLEFGSTTKPFILAIIATFIAAGFSIRKMDYLAIAIFSAAFFVLFGKAANVLNYLSHASGMPLADQMLANIETSIGINWLSILEYFNTHPLLAKTTMMTYDYLRLWSFMTVIALLVMQKHERLREFIILFAISATATIIIGAFLPAGGTYHYYQPNIALMNNINPGAGRFFLPQLLAIHDGSLTHINLGKVVGLITFPSFHVIMALLMAWAMRKTILFVPAALISSGIIVGTPVFGGHYFPDLIGGAIVTTFSIIAYYRWAGRKPGTSNPQIKYPIIPLGPQQTPENKFA